MVSCDVFVLINSEVSAFSSFFISVLAVFNYYSRHISGIDDRHKASGDLKRTAAITHHEMKASERPLPRRLAVLKSRHNSSALVSRLPYDCVFNSSSTPRSIVSAPLFITVLSSTQTPLKYETEVSSASSLHAFFPLQISFLLSPPLYPKHILIKPHYNLSLSFWTKQDGRYNAFLSGSTTPAQDLLRLLTALARHEVTTIYFRLFFLDNHCLTMRTRPE